MLVVDLYCENGHLFEGWFASGDDLSSQQARGLLSCPVCGVHEVVRRPSAARLNVSALKDAKLDKPLPPADGEVPVAHALSAEGPHQALPSQEAMQALYLQAVRHVLAHTEDVGERFAQEVRSMHRGEIAQRPVRGSADRQEVADLKEEGIDVLSMPIPEALKGPLQ